MGEIFSRRHFEISFLTSRLIRMKTARVSSGSTLFAIFVFDFLLKLLFAIMDMSKLKKQKSSFQKVRGERVSNKSTLTLSVPNFR